MLSSGGHYSVAITSPNEKAHPMPEGLRCAEAIVQVKNTFGEAKPKAKWSSVQVCQVS